MLRNLAIAYCLSRKSTGVLVKSICKNNGNWQHVALHRAIHITPRIAQVRSGQIHQGPVDFKIRHNDKLNSTKEATIAEANIELDDLELSIDGKKLVFNLTWLRDSCHCSKCTHQYSRQRLFTAKNFRRDQFKIDEVLLVPNVPDGEEHIGPWLENSTDGQNLRVEWADGHISHYSLDWLSYVDGLYSKSQLNLDSKTARAKFDYPQDDFYLPNQQQVTEYWNVSEFNSNLTPVDYHDLVDGFHFNNDATFINANKLVYMSLKRFNAMKSLSQQLVTYGLAKIINAPQERNQVLKVARSLAYERPTGYGVVFDVVVESSEDINLAYSSIEFDLHSDLTYRETSPGIQILHCIRNSVEGGMSYFSDSFKAAQTLQKTDPELFEVLLQFPATFVVRDPYRDIKFRRQKPVISLDYRGYLSEVYYSPFMLPPVGFKDDVKLFYLAFDKFTQLLQSQENKVIAKMNPGDIYIFHNRRVLHGRSAYDATNSSRFLQGCYMDWDEIKCLHEKLHSHQYTNSAC